MRPLALKILTLALTVFLLLSFSLSAFALPIRYWLATRDLDEHPHPHAFRNASFYIVIQTSYGYVLIPVFVKTKNVSNTVAEQKPTSTSIKNEVAE